MDHRIPKVGVVISVVLALGALVTFLFLNTAFEGPDPTAFLRNPYQLTARFKDTKTLPTKQAVLYKGISVGKVDKVDWDPDAKEGIVTFTLDDGFRIHRDGILQIGERSLLGDPYLNVASKGSDDAPELASGDEVKNTEPSVDFDEALAFLDKRGRSHVRSLIHTVADGVAPPGNGERLNGTLAGTARSVHELHTLTSTLHGQEQHIASLVNNASIVLDVISSREQQVRQIVAAGRSTLDALASDTNSLDQAMVELPRLLATGQRALAESRPLLREARPLTDQLRALTPDLTKALDPNAPHPINEITDNLLGTIEALPALRKEAVPVLGRTASLLRKLKPLVAVISPAARNLVPALRYLTPRVKSISGLYALVAAMTKNSNANGNYLRAGFSLDPNEIADTPTTANCDAATQGNSPNQGYCNNAYPGAGDANDPQPFTGRYPRIKPCIVPPRQTPRAPCHAQR